MSNTNEFKKILSAVGAISLTGAGIASLFTAGLAPLAWGSAAFILAGASASSFGALDKIGLSQDEKEQALAELEELRSQLKTAVVERNDYKRRLETEVAEFKMRCQELRDGIEYWETGTHPAILDLPPVKKLVETLRAKLTETSEKLQSALAEITQLKEENKLLRQRIAELENANDELDGELAARLLELAQLKTNFDYKLRDELHQALQPYCNQAVSIALEKKLAEIDKLRQAIAMQQEDLANYQQLMESLEKGTLPDIEKTYNLEMSARDSKLMELAGQNELLQQKIADLEAPRQFPGLTYADSAGNRIIAHFAQYGVFFDAHDASVVPGGFCLRFRVDRNQDKTKLSGEEFDKLTNQCGLMGISTQPIRFEMDAQNFLISVKVFSGFDVATGSSGKNQQDAGIKSLSTVGGSIVNNLSSAIKTKNPSQQGNGGSQVLIEKQDVHRQKFIDLGCFAADQFSQVVQERFVNRVRVCAGSTGGKSPILERIAVELAKLNNGILILVNPIPGSPKDWFRVPGVVQPGMNAERAIRETIKSFHDEFKRRRNNLEQANKSDYLILALDEDNATARDYEELGKFYKDVYQLSDHTLMGFVSAGQGLNVSGLSGGTTRKKAKDGEEEEKNVGNATKLMKEDFQNCTLVLTAEQATAWINKESKGTANKAEMLDKLRQLNELCDSLNEQEGLTARPKIGKAKKVSPNAYRIALVVSPAHAPFFIQLPAYSDFDLEGIRFPEGAKVTSTHWREADVNADRILHAFDACPRCLSTDFLKLQKPYVDGTPRFECRDCRKTFGKQRRSVGKRRGNPPDVRP